MGVNRAERGDGNLERIEGASILYAGDVIVKELQDGGMQNMHKICTKIFL